MAIDTITYFCGNCGKISCLPLGPLPENWLVTSNPSPDRLREGFEAKPLPTGTVVAMCSQACDREHSRQLQTIGRR